MRKGLRPPSSRLCLSLSVIFERLSKNFLSAYSLPGLYTLCLHARVITLTRWLPNRIFYRSIDRFASSSSSRHRSLFFFLSDSMKDWTRSSDRIIVNSFLGAMYQTLSKHILALGKCTESIGSTPCKRAFNVQLRRIRRNDDGQRNVRNEDFLRKCRPSFLPNVLSATRKIV